MSAVIFLNQIPFELDSASLARNARVRPGDAADFAALAGHARHLGQPKAIYTEAYVEPGPGSPHTVLLNGTPFTSAMLRQNLAEVERVFPFVVTCGLEMDSLALPENDFLQQFWWDGFKESLLASAFNFLTAHLEQYHRLGKTAVMSPGSGDAEVWPIEQQHALFDLLGDAPRQIGVTLTASCLMIPNKTISGILFPAEKDFRTCQVCRREHCPSRRAPFDPALWQQIHTA